MDGVAVQAVARTLDIHPFMLSRWRKEYREGKIVADKRKKVLSLKQDKTELDKLKRLEKENARLRQENDLLKKWQRFLAAERARNSASSTDTDPTWAWGICVLGWGFPAAVIMPGGSDRNPNASQKIGNWVGPFARSMRRAAQSTAARECMKS